MPAKIHFEVSAESLLRRVRNGVSYRTLGEELGCSRSTVTRYVQEWCDENGEHLTGRPVNQREKQAEGVERERLFALRSKGDMLLGNPPAGLSALDAMPTEVIAVDPLDTSIPIAESFALGAIRVHHPHMIPPLAEGAV